MNRCISDDTKYRALFSQDLETLAAGKCAIATPDPIYKENTFVGDILNHETDFIRMSFEHDAGGWIAAIKSVPGCPIGIIFHRVREPAYIFHPDLLAFGFEAARTWRVKQSEKELFCFAVH